MVASLIPAGTSAHGPLLNSRSRWRRSNDAPRTAISETEATDAGPDRRDGPATRRAELHRLGTAQGHGRARHRGRQRHRSRGGTGPRPRRGRCNPPIQALVAASALADKPYCAWASVCSRRWCATGGYSLCSPRLRAACRKLTPSTLRPTPASWCGGSDRCGEGKADRSQCG